jgi:hypothetical protein
MKEPLGAGLVASAIAVTAGSGVSIAADGWPEAALVALPVGRPFTDIRAAGGEPARE